MSEFDWQQRVSWTRGLAIVLATIFSTASLSQEAQQDDEAEIKRDIPYEGAFGPPKPPKPPLPDMQTPVEDWVFAALDVWYERPSPKGPEPIPLETPEAVYIEGGGPIIQVLPGPPAFPEKIPKRLQTVFPKKIPFSNNVKQLSEGSFRAVAYDRTLNDTKLSKDDMSVEISFTDFQGDKWRIEQVTLAPISPNPIFEPWYGGLTIDHPYHGQTGNGTPAEPLVRCMLCSWGWADIYQNDKRVASSALLHIMLTSDVRGDDFNYMCYDCKDNPVREVHVIVPPSTYLPTPGGFLHIMWEDSEWERGSPEQIAGLVPAGLDEQVPTIELSAVPYLAWNKTEIPVEVGKKYRLIVHNNDPSSFHQFHLHSHPAGEDKEKDVRHEHGGTAGGVGPLWKPGQKGHSSNPDHGSPPAPAAVFFPLPQGSTWATFVQFDKAGEYEFMCPVSNHYRRGMEGKFIVTEAGQQQAEVR